MIFSQAENRMVDLKMVNREAVVILRMFVFLLGWSLSLESELGEHSLFFSITDRGNTEYINVSSLKHDKK